MIRRQISLFKFRRACKQPGSVCGRAYVLDGAASGLVAIQTECAFANGEYVYCCIRIKPKNKTAFFRYRRDSADIVFIVDQTKIII